ncbi:MULTISPECIES: Imm5 family immunity protein [Actinomyces]|uniref:Immunity protein Imm5 domain-containing protein n=1 Tax=Actinomyces oris TaxID=544580 RepID=A0A1Q8VSY4_9ACTO|nr:Imm5 family immunity protein [Actinomyces oris]OLO51193.1 hypothetical protein BKH28_00760 [Actinomyces oris]
MIDIQMLNEQLHAGRTEVTNNPKGILSLARRLSIWRAMIDDDNPEWSYQTRVRLNSLCVHHVQHVWYQVFPEHSGIKDMLQLAHAVTEGRVNPDHAQEQASQFLQDVLFETELNTTTEPATFVADAAASAVISACHRNPYYEVEMDGDLEDDDLLPDSLDLSYCCSAALARGLNWQGAEDVDVEARRAFWLWYLNEAIPVVLRN